MITVIYHSADFDGIFCREIARHFLGNKDVQYIGWNFGDPEIVIPPEGPIYIMDLPVDKPFGMNLSPSDWPTYSCWIDRVIWIDHHASSIASHPENILGYRIDGVAACRLAWRWVSAVRRVSEQMPGGLTWAMDHYPWPTKQDFLDRKVSEPLAVRLAGEYDVWDRKWMAEDSEILTFQYGLKCYKVLPFDELLDKGRDPGDPGRESVLRVLQAGMLAQEYAENMDRFWLAEAGHIIEWEGLRFLAKNTVERGSNMFLSRDVSETGHDALLAYGYRGKLWTVSLYHAKHRTNLDLSAIAVKYGGGGHKGACGFTCKTLPFSL